MTRNEVAKIDGKMVEILDALEDDANTIKVATPGRYFETMAIPAEFQAGCKQAVIGSIAKQLKEGTRAAAHQLDNAKRGIGAL